MDTSQSARETLAKTEAWENVARGYLWLISDGHRYGFDVNRIDPDTIEVASADRCPLAQASAGHFLDAYDKVRADAEGPWGEDYSHAAYGFAAGIRASFAQLDAEWRRVMTEHHASMRQG